MNETPLENLAMSNHDYPFHKPNVFLNAEMGVCEIIGESFMEDSFSFYASVILWLEKYVQNVKKPILFNFKLTYFNTSTSKCILDMLKLLKKYEDSGGSVTVNWYYPEYTHEISVEEAEDFMIYTKLKINIIPMQES